MLTRRFFLAASLSGIGTAAYAEAAAAAPNEFLRKDRRERGLIEFS